MAEMDQSKEIMKLKAENAKLRKVKATLRARCEILEAEPRMTGSHDVSKASLSLDLMCEKYR